MKKKLFFLTLVTCLSIILMACSLSNLNVAKAQSTYLFSDGFESGLSAWTPYYGTLSINTQTVNNGSNSVQSVEVGNNENLYYHALGTQSGTIDFREYVYVSSTSVPSTSGDYYEVGGFSTSTAADNGDGEICVFNVNHVLYWGVFYRDVNVTTGSFPGFAFSISTDNSTSNAAQVVSGWTCVELRHTTGASSSSYGQEQLYVNGVSVVNVAADNSDRTPSNAIIAGSQLIKQNTDSWNYYIDDVAVSNIYIGQLHYQLTTSSANNIGTVSPPSDMFNESQKVTVTATPPTVTTGEQYVWEGWNGTGSGSYSGNGILANDGVSYTAQVTINSNITETASWQLQYLLTVNSPYGSAGSIGGANGWFNASSTAYAVITPTTVAGGTGTQYVFTSWSGAATGTASTSNAITMSGPETATANWQTQYYLTVSSTHGTPTGAGWYNASVNAYASTPLTVAGVTGTQYVFTGWSGAATGTTSPSNAIIMSGPKTATANWQTQYSLVFAQSGIGSDFSGTVMTVNGTNYGIVGFTAWANASDVYTFNYVASPLVVAANGEQYIPTGISGNSSASALIISAPTTVIGAYQGQYYLTVTSSYGSPSPTSGWFNNGTSITDFVVSSVAAGTGTQYACAGWTGTGSVPSSGGTSVATFTIGAASSITWNWQTQYLVSFVSNPSGVGTLSPSGANVWENSGPVSIFASTTMVDYKFSSWSASSGSVSFEIPSDSSTIATISGPGTITANFASVATPTPTPVVATPTPTPTHTATSTPKPTATASPKTSPSVPEFSSATAIIIVAILAIVAFGTYIFTKKAKR